MRRYKILQSLRLAAQNLSYQINYPLVTPRVLQISLTHRCNLHCKMCSVAKYVTCEQEELSLEEVKKIIAVARKQLRVRELILTGGEPLLWGGKLCSIVSFAHENNMRVLVTTNGFLLEQYAYDLVRAGVTHFHISLDGLKETHNEIRQNSLSFDRAVNGIKLLAEIKKRYKCEYSIGVGTVILKRNIPELGELYKYADMFDVNVFDLLNYLPDNTDFSSTDFTALWPNENDVKALIDAYNEIIRMKTKTIKTNPVFDIDLIVKYYRRTITYKDWRCFAGFKNFFIVMADPKKSGKYEPCLFLCKGHIPLRDFNYDFKKMWFSSQACNLRMAVKKCRAYCYQMCFSLPSLQQIFRFE